MKKHNIKLGFSLIEMIIVLVIMGIMTSTIIPILNTKKVKLRSAERYASEILQVINAEQNYYMNNRDKTTGKNIYTDKLKDLIDKGYLGLAPKNPFYGENDGKLVIKLIKKEDNADKKSTGTPGFKLFFYVPKDVVGVFYNTIPSLKIEKTSGNKLKVSTTVHIPGDIPAFDNLMHRDAGTDQELRTSHGPIQVTDNVEPKKSYIYITDDNSKTPQTILDNDVKNISPDSGVIKIGSISDNLDYGLIGGNKDGKLLISANKNDTPGKLDIGYDKDNKNGSKEIVMGIGKYINFDVKKGVVEFYGVNKNNENKKIAVMKYHYREEAPQLSYGSFSGFDLTNPYNNNGIQLAAFKDKKISGIKMGNKNKKEWMTYNSDGDKPISFIGSIGGVFDDITPEIYNKYIKKLAGGDCAGGTGKWKLVATGLTSVSLHYNNVQDYSYTLLLRKKIWGKYQKGIYTNTHLYFQQNSSPEYLSAISMGIDRVEGAGVNVRNGKMSRTHVNGKNTFTYFLMCLPKNNRKYNTGTGYRLTSRRVDDSVHY